MACLMFELSTPIMDIFLMMKQLEDGAEQHDKSHLPGPLFQKIRFVCSACFVLAFFFVRIVWGTFTYFFFFYVSYLHWGAIP